MRRFFRLDSTASGLLCPTWSFGSSCFDRKGCKIDWEPRRSEAMIADGRRLEIISCISSRIDGRLEGVFSGISFNRPEDCAWLNDKCWLAFVFAAKFSADDAAEDALWSFSVDCKWYWDWSSKLSPSSTIESLLFLREFVVDSTSLEKICCYLQADMIMKLFDANVIFHFSYCVLEMAAASNDTFFLRKSPINVIINPNLYISSALKTNDKA